MRRLRPAQTKKLERAWLGLVTNFKCKPGSAWARKQLGYPSSAQLGLGRKWDFRARIGLGSNINQVSSWARAQVKKKSWLHTPWQAGSVRVQWYWLFYLHIFQKLRGLLYARFFIPKSRELLEFQTICLPLIKRYIKTAIEVLTNHNI